MSKPKGTHNRRTLKAIEDRLEGKMNKDVQSYEIDGRSLMKIPIPELQRLRAEYTQRCIVEAGGNVFGQVTFR